MKKILITGGAGYIGSHIVHYILKKGYSEDDIIVFDNLSYGHHEFLPEKVIFVKGDLRNKNEIKQVFEKYDVNEVIHFAAYSYVGESMENPAKYYENNILGGLNLLESMRLCGCKYIVFSSSCAIYGIPKKFQFLRMRN